jgi:hypothetical protein
MKQIYTVLKLKDEFTPGIKKAASSTEALAVKAKSSNYHADKLATTLKGNLVKGAKAAATALVSAATAAATMATKLVSNTIEEADTIDKASQKIGISAEAYQQWEYAMGQCGVEISVMKTGVKTLTNLMSSANEGTASAQETFSQLGLSIYDANGNLKDQETMMTEAIKKLSSMESGTERAALATTLFGKAGSELAPLFNQGTEGVQALLDRAEELGLVIDSETISAGVKLGDTFDDVKRAFSAAAISIGGELLPYFQEAADWIIAKLPLIQSGAKKVAEGFKKMAEGAQWIYDKSDILIPVLGGVVAGIAAFKVISTITSLIKAWKAVTAAFSVVQGLANTTMLACPLTWIVLGITAVVAAGIALYKNWDKICQWAGKLKEKISNLLSPLKTAAEWLGKITGFSGTNVTVSAKSEGADDVSGQTVSVKKHALGTSYFVGGRTGFSEGGRKEEAVLPSGTRIIPADKAGKGQSNNINVQVIVQGNVIGNDDFADEVGERTAKKIREALAC